MSSKYHELAQQYGKLEKRNSLLTSGHPIHILQHFMRQELQRQVQLSKDSYPVQKLNLIKYIIQSLGELNYLEAKEQAQTILTKLDSLLAANEQ